MLGLEGIPDDADPLRHLIGRAAGDRRLPLGVVAVAVPADEGIPRPVVEERVHLLLDPYGASRDTPVCVDGDGEPGPRVAPAPAQRVADLPEQPAVAALGELEEAQLDRAQRWGQRGEERQELVLLDVEARQAEVAQARQTAAAAAAAAAAVVAVALAREYRVERDVPQEAVKHVVQRHVGPEAQVLQAAAGGRARQRAPEEAAAVDVALEGGRVHHEVEVQVLEAGAREHRLEVREGGARPLEEAGVQPRLEPVRVDA